MSWRVDSDALQVQRQWLEQELRRLPYRIVTSPRLMLWPVSNLLYIQRSSKKVQKLKASMKRGDAIPPAAAVWFTHETERLLVLDGNHRINAAVQLGLTAIPVLVVGAKAPSEIP